VPVMSKVESTATALAAPVAGVRISHANANEHGIQPERDCRECTRPRRAAACPVLQGVARREKREKWTETMGTLNLEVNDRAVSGERGGAPRTRNHCLPRPRSGAEPSHLMQGIRRPGPQWTSKLFGFNPNPSAPMPLLSPEDEGLAGQPRGKSPGEGEAPSSVRDRGSVSGDKASGAQGTSIG
jgi:hypothetical protein